MSKTTTDSHSEIKTNLKKWLNGWDDRIATHDDRHTQELSRERFNWCIGTINKILNDTDDQAMKKQSDNELKVKAMFKNQEKQFYKDLKKVADFMTCEMMRIENLYELKNRKSYENFKLRADIAKNK